MLSRLLKKHNVFKIAALTFGCFMAILFFSFVFSPASANAQVQVPTESSFATGSDYFGLNPVGQNIGLARTDIRLTIARIIRIALGMMGIVVLGYMIYGGYMFMTAAGDEGKVTEGKKVLINATIGVAIILSAFAIVQFVITQLTNAINDDGPGGRTPQGELNFNTYSGSGALGRVVRDHYPARDQKDVKRNTKIIITFKTAVNPASFVTNTNNNCWPIDLNDNTPVQIDETGSLCRRNTQGQIIPYLGDCVNTGSSSFSWENDCDRLVTSTIEIFPTRFTSSSDRGLAAAALVTYDVNRNVYTTVLRPLRALGDDLEDIKYAVRINNTLQRANEAVGVFTGLRSTYYQWNFTTGREFDIVPPHVVDVYPKDETVSRNTVLQINFSEAMDPMTVSGIMNSSTGLFNNLILGNNKAVGEWQLSNGYRTVELMPSIPCGLNSCGQNMYCLPTDCPASDTTCTSSYTGLARTARLFTNNSFDAVPFTGIADAAGNALDGNNDQTPQDKPAVPEDLWTISQSELVADNFNWNFVVENSIDRRAPYIREVAPSLDGEDVPGDATTTIGFSQRMYNNSFGSIVLREFASSTRQLTDDIWFYPSSNLVSLYDNATTTFTDIFHREYGPNNIKDFYYFVSVDSQVKSLNQNCMYPGRGPYAGTKNSSPTCTVLLSSDGKYL